MFLWVGGNSIGMAWRGATVGCFGNDQWLNHDILLSITLLPRYNTVLLDSVVPASYVRQLHRIDTLECFFNKASKKFAFRSSVSEYRLQVSLLAKLAMPRDDYCSLECSCPAPFCSAYPLSSHLPNQ